MGRLFVSFIWWFLVVVVSVFRLGFYVSVLGVISGIEMGGGFCGLLGGRDLGFLF